jgi:hypothetical protein
VTPLRICAIIVVIAALAMAGWLALVMPGATMVQADDILQDSYYIVANRQQSFLLAGALAAIGAVAAVVVLAAGTAMARSRLAAAGLWTILTGGGLVLVTVGLQFWLRSGWNAMRYGEVMARIGHIHSVQMATLASAALMVAGILLWIAARFAGRRKPG